MTAQTRSRKARFTHADLARAIRAATDAGLPVSRTRIMPSGEIVLEHRSETIEETDPHGTQPIDLVTWQRPKR